MAKKPPTLPRGNKTNAIPRVGGSGVIGYKPGGGMTSPSKNPMPRGGSIARPMPMPRGGKPGVPPRKRPIDRPLTGGKTNAIPRAGGGALRVWGADMRGRPRLGGGLPPFKPMRSK